MFSEITGTPYVSELGSAGVTGLLWFFSLVKRLTRLAHRLTAHRKGKSHPATRGLRLEVTQTASLLFYSAVRTSHRLDQIGDHGGKSLPLHREQCYTTRRHVFAQGTKSHLQSITGQHSYALIDLIATPASPKSQSRPLSGLKSRTPWPESGLQVDKSALLRLTLA